VFHAAVLFLVAAGLQLVFGVQKILNLACGSFYALGAYAGVSAVRWALGAGLPAPLFFPVLLGAGLALSVHSYNPVSYKQQTLPTKSSV
jgi:branched-chain amino acid transport system permease protein